MVQFSDPLALAIALGSGPQDFDHRTGMRLCTVIGTPEGAAALLARRGPVFTVLAPSAG